LIRLGTYLREVTRLAIGDPDDILAVRFAWSPLWETTHAVRSFLDPRARPYHQTWHQLVAERVARIDLEPLAAVQPLRGYVPDFLTPPPRCAAPRIRDQLAEVRATPASQIELELRRCRENLSDKQHAPLLDSLLRDPGGARDLLVDRLHEAWIELVAPFWARIRALLDGDIQERSRQLARHGLGRVLDDLHPRIRRSRRGLSVHDRDPRTVEIGQRGIVFMPSAYIWPGVAAIVDEPWQPTIAYPARGIAALWEAPTTPPEALGRLMGRTRALVLASLDRPASTHSIAAQLGLSPAGASGHLVALRDAGLLSPARHGHEVLYERTTLGNALLRSDAPIRRRRRPPS
jgi:DNA-binding transcriptional ArsR family regulator